MNFFTVLLIVFYVNLLLIIFLYERKLGYFFGIAYSADEIGVVVVYQFENAFHFRFQNLSHFLDFIKP
jgi:hypothetical protein